MNPASIAIHAQLSLLLIYGVLPLWLMAALADWWFHRLTHIERTSGWREAVLHWLMLAEIGLPALAATVFRFNTLIFVLLAAGIALHQLTVYLDLRYASARRKIPPLEQMTHSCLEACPAVAAALLAVVNAPAVLAGDFQLQLRAPPLAPATLGVIALALLLMVLLPYAEELRRCLRAPAME